jgi:hypothetical protein
MTIGIGEWLILTVFFLVPAAVVWRQVHSGRRRVLGGPWWIVVCLATGWLGYLAFCLVPEKRHQT